MRRCFQDASRGQSLVEFAIVLPAILLMMVVVFDLGRVVYYSSTVHNAAREGARYGIVNPDDRTGIKQKAIDFAIGLGLTPSNVNVCWHYDPDNTDSFPPPSVKVTVTYSFLPVTPGLSKLFKDGHLELTGEAVMKLEAEPTGTLACHY